MSLDGILAGRPVAEPPSLRSGRVTKVDSAGGVWVTLDGGDERAPIGPCLGARYRPVGPCPAVAHDHPQQPIPRGSRVLLVETDAGPWVASWEEPAP